MSVSLFQLQVPCKAVRTVQCLKTLWQSVYLIMAADFTLGIHGISNVGSLRIFGIFRSQIIVYLSNEL